MVFHRQKRCRIFALAESLGGVESLIEHPALMTHSGLSPERRSELGIGDSLVRISAGIEDCQDLIADLEQALAAVDAQRMLRAGPRAWAQSPQA